MARAPIHDVRELTRPSRHEERHGEESEEGKEDVGSDKEGREEDRQEKEVSGRSRAEPRRHRDVIIIATSP
jgi:hypothetical protein